MWEITQQVIIGFIQFVPVFLVIYILVGMIRGGR